MEEGRKKGKKETQDNPIFRTEKETQVYRTVF